METIVIKSCYGGYQITNEKGEVFIREKSEDVVTEFIAKELTKTIKGVSYGHEITVQVVIAIGEGRKNTFPMVGDFNNKFRS